MNLVIDIGNTAVKAGVFEEGELLHAISISPNDESVFRSWIERFAIRKTICSAVTDVPPFVDEFLNQSGVVVRMGSEVPLPVINAYASSSTLGNDRIANACAAIFLHPGAACLVIDLGTCLKFDFVDKMGVYRGGSIAPGMQMRYRALQSFTSKLPLVEASENADLIGNTTEGSIRSGVQNGMLYEMEGMIGEYREVDKDLKVLVTGGDAGFFIKRFKSSIFALPSLTLTGLNAILEHQHTHEK